MQSERTWSIRSVEINGGFLPGLSLNLPTGLVCIIGPRGSGKSTLAEALRFAISGLINASRPRQELIQANFGSSGLITVKTDAGPGQEYTVRRGYKQPAVLLTSDGRTVSTVDLDRGTFLPLDAYNGDEIEDIADEVLGQKRRTLLDELRGEELNKIHLSIGEHKRALEGNADRIRAVRRTIADLSERIEELVDVRAKLEALGPLPEDESNVEYSKAVKQQQHNSRELKRIEAANNTLNSFRRDLEALSNKLKNETPLRLVEAGSGNATKLEMFERKLQNAILPLHEQLKMLYAPLDAGRGVLKEALEDLRKLHSSEAEVLSDLQQLHEEESELVRQHSETEQQITILEELESERAELRQELANLVEQRKSLKANFLLEREQISALRTSVAQELQREAGEKVRVRVLRNADDLAYRTLLTEGLKGARVRNHEEILHSLLQLRPEQLAQFIHNNDSESFDQCCSFGTERARKILDAFRENVDPLKLEVIEIEDRICIELNVSTGAEPIYKDAADLSQGQKCTALLPLLLARRNTPLIIDQPEDNLDNPLYL